MIGTAPTRLVDFLDKGASLGAAQPCLTMNGATMSYGAVQAHSYRLARALQRAGIGPGDKVAILSGNDPVAFACIFGISRAGAVWCPINPRNEAAETCQLLEQFDCRCLIFHSSYAALAERIIPDLPALALLICLDATNPLAGSLADQLDGLEPVPIDIAPNDDIAMIAGTGGTTGKPKGVMLSGRNLEAMSAITLMSYPFESRPQYLAFAPLTHAAGVLCFPIMLMGGRIVIVPKPDLSEFFALIAHYRITHVFLPPTLIYLLLDHPALAGADLTSMQCFWYGAAPIAPKKLQAAINRFGPVMAQLFGQTEAPMMIATMAPADHFNADGTIARHRLAAAGRASPLVTLAIMDPEGALLPPGERGEIVVRGSLVMQGYYKDPEATAATSQFGWHHTGDIGYLDAEGFLFIVDRAKDMIITGGFNVYSIEVEQALLAHHAVLDCAVFGLADEKWGERVAAAVQLRPDQSITAAELAGFVKSRIGSVKTPKQIEFLPDLPRSKIGKVLKAQIRSMLGTH